MFKRLQKLLPEKSHGVYEVAGASTRDGFYESSQTQPLRCGNSHTTTSTSKSCGMYEITNARERIPSASSESRYQMRRTLHSDSDSGGITPRGPAGCVLADVAKLQSCDNPGKRLPQTELKAGPNQNLYYMTSL